MRYGRFKVCGKRVRLDRYDPDDTSGYKDKQDAQSKLEADIERLRRQQDLLYASRSYALLVILQGIDTAGKDGVIKHVMSGLNPQGVDVHSFKQPTEEELNHDFLWRCVKVLPERGRIGIFNRSYYEEVLVTRVKPDVLKAEHLPRHSVDSQFWKERYRDINHFESYLVRNATVVLKFFLLISKAEQRKRLLDRVQTPHKHWKFSPADVDSHLRWKQYQTAYEAMLSATGSDEAPWYVVPSNHKWAARVVVADVIATTIEAFKLRYPKPRADQRRAIEAAGELLRAEE
jgi:PPK2 family polyphosphate:nucleotide phosphotransferase